MPTSQFRKKQTLNGRRGYRGLSAEQLDEERRTRIVQTATQLFGEYGYGSTRIDTICRHAKVSTRHFYELFSGRDAVLEATYDQVLAQVACAVHGALVCRGGDLTHRLADAAEAAVHTLLIDPARGRIACIEIIGVSETLDRKRMNSTAQLAGLVQRHVDHQAGRGRIPAGDYYLPTLAGIGMFNELITIWLTGYSDLSAADMAVEARRIFLAMMHSTQQCFAPNLGSAIH